MATLVSPGVSVTVTDQSAYASSGPGTVPMVVFATAANKLQSGSNTTIAPGTLTSNAGNLYLLTSQRDVLTTFGSPNFYTVSGSPQYDNELNELGLFALYQYLGIANTAYALRADIDLAQLAPSSTAPVGPIADGKYWLDLSQTSWGIFRSNGNINSAYAWQAETPLIISTAANLEAMVQGYTANLGGKITSSSASLIASNGNLIINGVTVSLSTGDSLTTVASKINLSQTLANMGITASVFARVEKYALNATGLSPAYGDVFSLRLTSTNINWSPDLSSSDDAVLTTLGLAAYPTPVIAPSHAFGTAGNYAVDAYSITNGNVEPSNNIWEKVPVTTSTGTTAHWMQVGSVDTDYPGWAWTESVPRVLTGTVANPTALVSGQSFTLEIGDSTTFTITLTSSALGDMVTAINTVLNTNSINALASIYTVGRSSYLRITNYDGTSIQIRDVSTNPSALTTPLGNAGISSTTYYYNSVQGQFPNPTYNAATLLTSSATVNAPGENYLVGDILTVLGGTYATASNVTVTSLQCSNVTVSNGGTNYNQGDTLTFSGGSYTTAVILTVTEATGGIIQSVQITQAGQYTGGSIPSNPVAPTTQTGSGSNATFNLVWGAGTVSVLAPGSYTQYPNPLGATTSGGTGAGATLNLTAGYLSGDAFTIDPGTGVPVTIVLPAYPNNTLSGVVNAINAAFPPSGSGAIVASILTTSTGNYLKITNSNGTQFGLADVVGTPLDSSGIMTGITYGRSLVYQGYGPTLTVPSNLSQVAPTNVWINTTSTDRGVNLAVNRYVNGAWVRQNSNPNTQYVPLYSSDAYADAGFGANKQLGSIYARYDVNMASIMLYIWQGTTNSSAVWSQLDYVPSILAPSGPPEDGTLWYSTNLRYDFMVSDGQVWLGYREVFPGTDVNGPILSASQPISQSTGAALVDSDIWVDTSNSKVFTAYRYDGTNAAWRLIDNTDHSTPAGIIFSDARATADGTLTGSTLPSDMVLSSIVDPDAPDAHLYPARMLLCNTRYSTDNVKVWRSNYFPNRVVNGVSDSGRWVTDSGNAADGSPYIGSAAQRAIVVRALKSALASSTDARAEQKFFNIMATPGYVECLEDMVTLNTDKKNVAFIIGDTPSTLDPSGTSIQNWATNAMDVADNGPDGLTTADPYIGIYYPWALSTNLDGTSVFVPPSTLALRTYAYNDQVAYPWFAPAGFNRGLVTDATSVGYLKSDGTYQPLVLNQGQRDVLYTNNINPIAYITNRGLVIYGQKTLNPISSALDRVNVARLINYLSYNLDNLAKPFLFEQNDTQTRQSVLTVFNGFMGTLISLRALYDFAVVCDASNNTPATIDANELWIDIAIKPEKSIEFIYIPIRILNTGDPLPGGSKA